MEDAASACSTKGADLEVTDGGDSLIVDSDGMDGSGVSSTRAELANTAGLCVLDALDVPASTVSKVQDTSAVDGRQSDSTGDYDLSWTYTTDDGLALIVEKS